MFARGLSLRAASLGPALRIAAPSASSPAVRSLATVAQQLNDLAKALPHKEAVRYAKQNNMKWTLSDVKRYSDALASGLLELGLSKKSTIVTCLPSNTAEYHALQFTCCRGGFVLASLPSDCQSPAAFISVLKSTSAAVLVTPDVAGTFNYLDFVSTHVVPELADYDDGGGEPFQSKEFPKLMYAVHTGFNLERGFANYKHLFAFNGEPRVAIPDEKDAVFQEYDKDGKKVGKALNQTEIMGSKDWKVVADVLNKVYVEP